LLRSEISLDTGLQKLP